MMRSSTSEIGHGSNDIPEVKVREMIAELISPAASKYVDLGKKLQWVWFVLDSLRPGP